MRIKARPSSLWTHFLIGHRASPLVGLILEGGYFEVATFFIIGAEFKPVSPSALVQLGCTPKSARIAEPEINNGIAPVCCKSGFNCMHSYYASSRSWSIQAFCNANHVGTTNSPTGQHSGTKDLTYREFCRLSRVSQLFLRFLSSSRSDAWNVASSAVRRLR